MWIWIIAGVIFGFLMIISINTSKERLNASEVKNEVFDKELNNEDDIFEEFLILDLLDEEEELEESE